MMAYIRLGLLVMVIGAMLVTAAWMGASPGTTERVSVDSAGVQADGSSDWPAISGDGRYVAFQSEASNLVPGDTNGCEDLFVHDRQTGATERVSVDSAGNEANGGSAGPAISADGRYVAFASEASNLVPEDTNAVNGVFVHDRQTGATERVSVDSAGGKANGVSGWPAISADGRYVAFASSTFPNAPTDEVIFVHDRQTGVTERVSESHGSLPAISADGRYCAFQSGTTNGVVGDTNGVSDIFVRDRQTGLTERVSVDSARGQADGSSALAAISADGRYVAFESSASNLVLGDTNTCGALSVPGQCPDIFVHDRQTGVTERVSVDSAGNQANSDSDWPAISGDGRYVAFDSSASNLVAGDTNTCAWGDVAGMCQDIFVHDRGEAPTQGQLTVCPPAGKWALSVWDGPSGMATGAALTTCTDVSIDAAYWLDPASQLWWRYFPGLLDISDLLTLDALQPIIVHGS